MDAPEQISQSYERSLQAFGRALVDLLEDPSAINVAHYLRASRELEAAVAEADSEEWEAA